MLRMQTLGSARPSWRLCNGDRYAHGSPCVMAQGVGMTLHTGPPNPTVCCRLHQVLNLDSLGFLPHEMGTAETALADPRAEEVGRWSWRARPGVTDICARCADLGPSQVTRVPSPGWDDLS